jgi:hypothetical protein
MRPRIGPGGIGLANLMLAAPAACGFRSCGLRGIGLGTPPSQRMGA